MATVTYFVGAKSHHGEWKPFLGPYSRSQACEELERLKGIVPDASKYTVMSKPAPKPCKTKTPIVLSSLGSLWRGSPAPPRA